MPRARRTTQASGGVPEEFQRLFARQLEQSQTIQADSQVAFNRSTIDLVRRFSEYMQTMHQTMGEHSGLIAHLLDPDERLLIGK